MTFDDLIEKLKREDEVTILEILNLNSEDLTTLLWTEIYDRQDRVRDYYDETDETVDGEEAAD